jgi:hypothetical protein
LLCPLSSQTGSLPREQGYSHASSAGTSWSWDLKKGKVDCFKKELQAAQDCHLGRTVLRSQEGHSKQVQGSTASRFKRDFQADSRYYRLPRQDANSKQFVGFTADLTDKESVEYKKLTHIYFLLICFEFLYLLHLPFPLLSSIYWTVTQQLTANNRRSRFGPKIGTQDWWLNRIKQETVSIHTYLERSQRSTQEPKRDPSGPEGTARTPQAADSRAYATKRYKVIEYCATRCTTWHKRWATWHKSGYMTQVVLCDIWLVIYVPYNTT